MPHTNRGQGNVLDIANINQEADMTTTPIVLTIFTDEDTEVPAVEEQFADFAAAQTRLDEIVRDAGDSVGTVDGDDTTQTFTLTSGSGQCVGHGTIGPIE